MIGNIADQNKQLSDAGKKPIDTSYRTDAAIGYSGKIAYSAEQGRSEGKVANQETVKVGAKKIQGSYAGLIDGKSAYLQPNDRGYDSKALQGARGGERALSTVKPSLNIGGLINSKNNSIINNYAGVTSKDSSSNRLNAIVKNNMMFG